MTEARERLEVFLAASLSGVWRLAEVLLAASSWSWRLEVFLLEGGPGDWLWVGVGHLHSVHSETVAISLWSLEYTDKRGRPVSRICQHRWTIVSLVLH